MKLRPGRRDRRQLVEHRAVDDRQHDERRPLRRAAQPPAQTAGPEALARAHAAQRSRRPPDGASPKIEDVSDLWVTTLGEVPYADAVALQERLRDARQADAIPDTLLLLEHPPVYTRGRRARPADLPRGEQWYRDQGIDVAGLRPRRPASPTTAPASSSATRSCASATSVRDYVAAMERAMVAALRDEGDRRARRRERPDRRLGRRARRSARSASTSRAA